MRHVLQTMAIVVTRGLRARAWIGHDGRMKIKEKSGENREGQKVKYEAKEKSKKTEKGYPQTSKRDH